MSFTYTIIAAAVPLAAMVISDFRKRNIGIAWLVLFYAITAASAVLAHGWRTALLNTAGNIVFLALLFGFLYIYIRVRKNRFASFGKAIGLGDILFLPALAPVFGVRQFSLFLTASFIVTLVAWSILRLLGRAPSTIPLVSTVGICFIIYSLILFL